MGYNSLAHELHLYVKQQGMEVELQEDVFGYFLSQMSNHPGLDRRMLQLMKFYKLLHAIMMDRMEYKKPQTQQK
jgi:hypothetical protein